MRTLLFGFTLIVCWSFVAAQPEKNKPIQLDEPLKRIAPHTPEESAKLFEIHPDFKIELAAAEPLVMSPVAAEFDEDGRLYVVELPEYNQSGSEKPHGKGRVVMLEDTKGDGKFDKRTVVVDHLEYPTAVFPWDGGLFVGAAPHLIYCKDGKQTVMVSGFGIDKAGEGQLNSFRWSLENRILISTGLDGGDIRRQRVKEDEPINAKRENLLLDPRLTELQATSGGGQHGLTLDDWGNTFVCGNSDPCQHLTYDTRYLKNNRAIQAQPPMVSIAPEGKFTKLNRISEVEPWRIMRTKLRKDGTIPGSDEGGQPSGFFTGATGITAYRGDAFPKEFKGNVFVGEVANNLVYRAKLTPKGASFIAERADTGGKEFLASKDVWFRPVQFIQGPDGCLYVIDMYRELIEGAAFLAPAILKNVDASAGVDKGRIWRIAPKDFRYRKPPVLSKTSTVDLVALLDHPNGWHRDTAARLLYQRQDELATPHLEKMVAEAKTSQGRIHAMYALEGMTALMRKTVVARLGDSDPWVRVHAIRLLDRMSGKGLITDKDIARLMKDDDPQVRHQLAWTLSNPEYEMASIALAAIAKRDLKDPSVRLAVAVAATSGQYFNNRLDLIAEPELRKTPEGRAFIETLVETAGAHSNQAVANAALRGITLLRDEEIGFQVQLLGVLTRRASEQNVKNFRRKANRDVFEQLLERARETAEDLKAEEAERASAIRALAIVPYDEVRTLIASLLKPTQPKGVQIAALDILGRSGATEVPEVLLKVWPSLSPAVRASATEVFFSRFNWMQSLFDAIEQKKVARSDIDPARVALLRKSPNRAVRIRVEEIFGATVSNRKEVIQAYQKALTMKGDLEKGKAIFKTNCAACHKLDGVGEEVGADLKAIRDRGAENTMLNILDPNREVKPQFLAYQLETKNGKAYSGMLTAETPNTVTIRQLDGRSETIPRNQIDTLRSTGLSFMPEGLEKQVDLQAMADLLAYLNSIK